ncbi:CGNR zinc finger domain-containing protein [Leifsonia flava]|uniref:Zf-CGNR multi-domain protein n=1 Tax=Orlajensenia leifsoniae TaxID=2561933 RepID=A0A4Y9QVX3_9MICO|nr:CGNR zinc finger domain-containing protein [Leifsonia flava]TFV96360.1 zf-CGNR multi-domain protein [Leifsonia flava]
MTDGGNVLTSDGSGATAHEDLLVDFLNTLDVEELTDTLASEGELATWATARGFVPGGLEQVLAVRNALRALASGEEAELPDLPVRVAITARSVTLTPSTVAEAVLASALTLGIEGRLRRVKLCYAHDCAWAFYDRSRNGSRTWCDMGVCGNRAKVRTYRANNPGPPR